MAVYPAAIPTVVTIPDAGADLSTNPHSALHNDLRDEVIAALAELGISPSGADATVRARLDRIDGTPTAWTPTISSVGGPITLGSGGAIVGQRIKQGRLNTVWGRIIFGGAGRDTGSGAFIVSLPVNADTSIHVASTDASNGDSIGAGHARDFSDAASNRDIGVTLRTATAISFVFNGTVNPASPFTWANLDVLTFHCVYLSAS
jgi:hypothetical protein